MSTKGNKVTINTASGALSPDAIPDDNQKQLRKQTKKHPGGRPKKKTPKAENRTISTDPILFEKYLIISARTNKASLSEFLRHAVESYCQQNSISLYDDELNKQAIANYEARKERSKKEVKS